MTPRPVIAFLVNQYPKISHRFIWREIVALEEAGVTVARFSTRRSGDNPPDAEYRAELDRTTVLLEQGLAALALAAVAAFLTNPTQFLNALGLTLRHGFRGYRGVVAHLAYLAEAALLLKLLRQRGVRHVHAHFATNTAFIAMLCRMLGGPPYSFTAHGPDDFDLAYGLALDEKIARAKVVFSISHYGRTQLMRWCRSEDWSKVHRFDSAVDSTFLQPHTPVPASPRLVSVGRLDMQKGQMMLIDAVQRLRDSGTACELLLIGGGPLRPQLEARIREHGLQEQVKLCGAAPTPEMIEIIRSSRALVMASLAENIPSVIMEAFSLGRPAIATAVGGIPEMIEPGVSGWLVPPGDVEGLARAMREALESSPGKLDEMGRAGRRRVDPRHRQERLAEQLLERFQC